MISAKYNDDYDWRNEPDEYAPLLFDYDEDLSVLKEDSGLDLNDLPSRSPDKETENLDLEDPVVFDSFIEGRVCIPKGDGYQAGTFKQRKRDADGNLIGVYNENPILDSRAYEVEFQDRHVEEYTANLLAEAMFSRCDSNGHHILIIDKIIDHVKSSSAVSMDENEISEPDHRKQRPFCTTKGWHFCVSWKDGTSSWHSLKELKEVFPVKLAEYAINNQLSSESVFSWWVPFVIKKKDRIIKKIKSKYWERSHKYGVRMPKSVEEALLLYQQNGNHLWRNAIEKEMLNNKIAFEILKDGAIAPIGYTQICCHMTFDVKFDFTRKACFVAGGHLTDAPASITYSTVVTRETVRIAFTIAALNELDILAADIGKAYLNAPCREKVYFCAGAEFGTKNKGRLVVIVRALYGLKSSGAAWHAFFAASLGNESEGGLGFVPCTRADPDMWRKAETRSDGSRYYSYILVYVDDILVLHEDPTKYMNAINDMYRLKDGPIEKPTNYLGVCIREWTFEDGTKCWAIGAKRYIKWPLTR